ncbi:hypothetical protein K470DRAFT_294883 [Piedraia hortae CBS 480.64]|uniref:VHS domain-containing protein n=1 Tax=Piedraia hortae CBS 480.64 TaxID=1314780 RepID=A0A6A7BYZ5_9PEZI|nr:hypothetical protein K470DRAFT_294883 [Piedraia hortae CBS 480.64]
MFGSIPYTAIFGQIENLVKPHFAEEELAGIRSIVDDIRQQPRTGAREAAWRIFQILVDFGLQDGLNDDDLQEQLTWIGILGPHPDVRRKSQEVMLNWSIVDKNNVKLKRFAQLFSRIPLERRVVNPDAARQPSQQGELSPQGATHTGTAQHGAVQAGAVQQGAAQTVTTPIGIAQQGTAQQGAVQQGTARRREARLRAALLGFLHRANYCAKSS